MIKRKRVNIWQLFLMSKQYSNIPLEVQTLVGTALFVAIMKYAIVWFCYDTCILVSFYRTILLSIISLLNEPNTFSPANVDASVMYRKWKDSKGKDKEYENIIR